MKIFCARCKQPILSKDRRRKTPRLVPVNGAKLTAREREAPRVLCACGLVNIWLEASLS